MTYAEQTEALRAMTNRLAARTPATGLASLMLIDLDNLHDPRMHPAHIVCDVADHPGGTAKRGRCLHRRQRRLLIQFPQNAVPDRLRHDAVRIGVLDIDVTSDAHADATAEPRFTSFDGPAVDLHQSTAFEDDIAAEVLPGRIMLDVRSRLEIALELLIEIRQRIQPPDRHATCCATWPDSVCFRTQHSFILDHAYLS